MTRSKCRHHAPMWPVTFYQGGKLFVGHFLKCLTCNEWLPLGPANDEPVEVQIEMRAAEIAHPECEPGEYRNIEWAAYELCEEYSDADDRGQIKSFDFMDRWYQSGYLARIIHDHAGNA